MTIGEITKEKDKETYDKLMQIGKENKHKTNNNSKQNRQTNR